MTNPESRSIELDELALSDDADTVDNDDDHITEAEIRELSAYGFESNDRTWVGIGTSQSAQSNETGHFDIEDETLVGIGTSRSAGTMMVDDFDSDDRTLVGMGPVERAERASRARQAEEPPESVRMPQSEPPGPFVAADDELPTGPGLPLPMQRGGSWALLVPAALVAAAGVIVLRGLAPHSVAPHAPAAAHDVRQSSASETAVHTGTEARANETGLAESTTRSAGASESVAVASNPTPASDATGAGPTPPPGASARSVAPAVSSAMKRTDRASTTLGSLDIMSSPAANVVLDGRPLGKAPGVVKVASGPHTVVFIHPERGRMVLNVNVTPGHTTSAAAEF